MDAHSISYTTPSRRGSSRVYLDLSAYYKGLLTNANVSPSLGSSLMETQRFFDPVDMPHIGVVGAGVAGLRCAEVLIRHGFKVTILEGRNRIGGRMHSATLPSGHLVDMGPNWIHGTEHNPILDLAKETQTVTHSWDDAATVFYEDGTQMPEDEARDIGGAMWGIVLEAFQESNRNTANIPNHASLFDYFEKKVEEKFPGGKEDFDKKRKLVLQLSEMWGAFVGSKIQHQSMKFFWLEECIDGENLFVASTYQKILNLIGKTALERADIKYSQKVTKVFSGSSTDEKTPSKVTVSTENGDKFEFDELVMTTPLGWLKRNKASFEPPLPKRFAKAIDSVSYGCLEKVYITFPAAFWNKPTRPSNSRGKPVDPSLSEPSDPSEPQPQSLSRAVSLKEKANPSKSPIGFSQWLSPLYSLTTNPKKWHQECVNLASLPGSTAQPTLLFYIFGDQSRELSKQLADIGSSEDPESTSDKSQQKQNHLQAFFEPYYSLFPNYDPKSPDCTPTSLIYTDWLSDDLAGNGSYANFEIIPTASTPNKATSPKPTRISDISKEAEPEPQVLDEDIQIMREGLSERGIWFAGEHVAPFVALGTVTGAWWSGEGVGGRIAGAYGIELGRGEEVDEGIVGGGEDGEVEGGDGAESPKEVNFRSFGDEGVAGGV